MKIKIILATLAIILAALACLLLSPGCISNDDSDKALATWKATTETAVAAINKEIATMKNLIAEKAPASQVNALEAKVNAGGTGNSYKKDETYTRSEIESKISAAIQALKDEKPWKTNPVPGSKTPSADDDNVLATTSDLVLALERPVEDEFYLTDNETSPYIKLSITNNDSSSHMFRLKADFDCDDPVTMSGAVLTCDYSYSSGVVMKIDGDILNVTTSTIGFTSRRSAGSTDMTWYIGKARSESIYLRFKPDYASDSNHTWSWSFTLKQVD